jgi:hypothetical protein
MTTRTQPLWRENEIEIPAAKMTLKLAEALRKSYSVEQFGYLLLSSGDEESNPIPTRQVVIQRQA